MAIWYLGKRQFGIIFEVICFPFWHVVPRQILQPRAQYLNHGHVGISGNAVSEGEDRNLVAVAGTVLQHADHVPAVESALDAPAVNSEKI
jgi:hypothetical protein